MNQLQLVKMEAINLKEIREENMEMFRGRQLKGECFN